MTREERAKMHAEALGEILRLSLVDSSTDQVDLVGKAKAEGRKTCNQN